MAGRILELAIAIKGSLEKTYTDSMRKAISEAGNLQKKLQGMSQVAQGQQKLMQSMGDLKGIQASIQRFRELKQSVSTASAELAQAQTTASRYAAELRRSQASVEQLRQKHTAMSASASTGLAQAQATVSKYAAELRRSQTATEQLRQKHAAMSETLRSLKGKIPTAEWKQLSAEAKALKEAMKESAASTRAAGEAFKQAKSNAASLKATLNGQLKDSAEQLKKSEAAAKAMGRSFEQAKSNAASLKSMLAGQQAELQRLRAGMASAGYSAQNLAQNEIRLRQEIQQTSRALAQAAEEQNRLNARRKAQENNNNAQQNMFNAYGNFQGAVGSAKAVMQPFAGAIENAMTFEHAMSKVKALTQSGLIREGDLDSVNANMQKLEEQARALGATTQFTMTQAADAMGYLGMAGWKTEQIYGTMPGMLDLAAGAGTDLARTADIVSDNMTAMGVPVEQAGHFMDVYAYALTNANVNLESLGETMKYAAPVAAAFGATLEDTAAMTMMMGNAGIKGSQAGTALRMGLLRLSGPPKKASKEMEALGISVSDATAMAMEAQAEMARLGINVDENASPMDKMSNIVKQLQVKMQGLSREEKLAAVGAIFGANAASGWLNVIEQGSDVFDQYRDALQNSDGYAKQFAQTMNDDTKGAMIALDSATDAVVNALGSAFLPVVREIAEAVTPAATSMSKWLSEHKEIAMAAGIAAAALSGLMVAAAGVQLAFASWQFLASTIMLVRNAEILYTAQTKLSAAATLYHAKANTIFGASMKALKNPIATITGLLGAFPTKLSGMKTSFVALPAKIAGAFKNLPATIAGAFKALPGIFATISTLGLPAILIILAIGTAIALIAANFDKLKETATIVFSHISGTVSAMSSVLQAKFAEALARITQVWNSITGQSKESCEILGVIFNNLGFMLGAAFDIAAGIVTTAIAVIINSVASMIEIIGGVLNIIAGIVTGDWTRLWEGCRQVVDGFANGVLGTLQSLAGGISNIFDTLMGKAHTLINTAQDASASVSAAAGSYDVSHNAAGGIYRKGVFLTTFAENSAEAAIPLDGTPRAVSLWQQAGELLGVLPKDTESVRNLAQVAGENKFPTLPAMSMMDALPPTIGAIAELAMPPTEAEMAAAPVALEPPAMGGNIEVNFNPQITIQGNADGGTVSQMGDMLTQLKAELMREVERKLGGMLAAEAHERRRTSYAT